MAWTQGSRKYGLGLEIWSPLGAYNRDAFLRSAAIRALDQAQKGWG